MFKDDIEKQAEFTTRIQEESKARMADVSRCFWCNSEQHAHR